MFRFKGSSHPPTPPVCLECEIPIQEDEADATVLNDFRCDHDKKIHFVCALKKLSTGEFTKCPECQKPFKSVLRHCLVCSGAITDQEPDATGLLGETAGCEHADCYHRACVEAATQHGMEMNCLICAKSMTSRICMKCLEVITLEDPDANGFGTLNCQHAEMFHARCVQNDDHCSQCAKSSEAATDCVICREDFSSELQNSVRLACYDCKGHAETICFLCTLRSAENAVSCSICREPFKYNPIE